MPAMASTKSYQPTRVLPIAKPRMSGLRYYGGDAEGAGDKSRLSGLRYSGGDAEGAGQR